MNPTAFLEDAEGEAGENQQPAVVHKKFQRDADWQERSVSKKRCRRLASHRVIVLEEREQPGQSKDDRDSEKTKEGRSLHQSPPETTEC